MAKVSEVAHIEFIKDFLRKGEKRKTILANFSKKWQSVSVRVFDCRLKEAKAQFQVETKHIEHETSISIQKETEARKEKICAVLERQEILSAIARGEIKLKQWFIGKDYEVCKDVVPNYADRRAAIAELNKMDGDYAPAKTDITTNGESISPPNIIIQS